MIKYLCDYLFKTTSPFHWPGTAAQQGLGEPGFDPLWAALKAAWRAAWRDCGIPAARGSSCQISFHQLLTTHEIQMQMRVNEHMWGEVACNSCEMVRRKSYSRCSIPSGAEPALSSSRPAAATRRQTEDRGQLDGGTGTERWGANSEAFAQTLNSLAHTHRPW